MTGWLLVALFVGVPVILLLLAVRLAQRPSCPCCYYPLHRCDCPERTGGLEGLDP